MDIKKYLWGLVGFALIIQVAAAQADTSLSVSPYYSNLNLGDSLSVTIDITTMDSVYAFDISVYYDPAVLEATGLSEGGFLNSDGESTFTATSTIDNGLGKVQLAVSRFNTQAGVTGSGTLFTIDFDAMGAGTSQIDMDDAEIIDSTLTMLGYDEYDGSAKVNTPPEIGGIVISPVTAYTLDTLDCGFLVNDPDVQDTARVDITWLRNGLPWAQDDENGIVAASGTWGNTGPQGDIEPGDTVKGDSWMCRVRAYDGLSEASQDSAPVVIQNSLPSQPVIDLTPDSSYTVDNLVCIMETPSKDNDNDSILYSYEWYRDGVLQGLTGTFVPSSQTERGQTWRCVVTPNDGEGDGPSGQDQVLILNSRPAASGLGIGPSSPLTSDDLVGSYSYSDADLDPESGTEIRWYRDSVLQSGYNDLLVIPSSATQRGEEWYFTVRPRDGTGFGDMETSPSILVLNTPPSIQEVYAAPGDASDELVCWFRVTDDDLDSLFVNITWLRNGLPWAQDDEGIPVADGVLTGTSSLGNIESGDLEYMDSWECLVTALDDEGSSSSSGLIDVLNSAFVNPLSYGASVGGSFGIGIDMESMDDVYTVSFTLAFDPDIMNVTSAVEGDFLGGDGASTNPLISIDNELGVITYTNSRIGVGYGTSGSGSLLDIEFYARTAGSSGLGLDEIIVMNSGLETEASALRDGDVTVVFLPGDVDKDCDVDIFDLASVGLAYGSRPGDGNWNPDADVHPIGGDEAINIFDLAAVGLNYGNAC